jgi:hypothetical protein
MALRAPAMKLRERTLLIALIVTLILSALVIPFMR